MKKYYKQDHRLCQWQSQEGTHITHHITQILVLFLLLCVTGFVQLHAESQDGSSEKEILRPAAA